MSLRVLGIESSCDETAAAVIDREGALRADVLYSQVPIHAPYGGIVPELASRAHLQKVRPIVDAALAQAGIGLGELDGIAVTRGPGLVGSLLVGVCFARALGFARRLPVVGVHHLEGHLLAPFLERDEAAYPFVGLVVSGGHTSLFLARGLGDYELLGRTRDDAAGEAFDKAAKLMGLGYPGGPVIAELAREGDPAAVALPRGMWAKGGLDTSFSGLKTALYNHVRAHGVPDGQERADLCASLQAAVVDVLVHKLQRAVRQTRVRRIVLSGGVAANESLRSGVRRLGQQERAEVLIPPPRHCTDNGAMIALAGRMRLQAGLPFEREFSADAGWELGG